MGLVIQLHLLRCEALWLKWQWRVELVNFHSFNAAMIQNAAAVLKPKLRRFFAVLQNGIIFQLIVEKEIVRL